jgi:outer membrane protein W
MKQTTKIQLSVAIMSTLFATQANAQGLYVSAGGGYGFSMAPNSSFSANDYTRNPSGIGTVETYKISNSTGSFGRGVQFGATVGYMFSENIGAELNIGYLVGSKITTTDKELKNNGDTYSSTATASGNMLRLTPALRFSVGKDKLKPYMRVGLVIGVGNKIATTFSSTDFNASNGKTNIDQSEMALTGGVSMGFAAGIGVNYMFSDKVGIFAELGIISQAWAPSKSVLTKSTSNGADNLPFMTTSQKETDYVSSYTTTSGTFSPGTPSVALKQYTPFSSVGINVGVHLAFGK